MDRLEELAIFVRIVEEGSLINAARRLRRSPQAVTRALAALEDRIGQRLVDRTTRRLAATEAGLALFERARILLNDYDTATLRTPEAPVRGLLRITAPVQFGRRHIVPIVTIFLDRFPGVRIELLLNDRNVDLIEEGIDIALRIGALSDSGLTARRLGEVTRQWVASPAYLRARGVPRTPDNLTRHETIQAAGPGIPEWTFSIKQGSTQQRGAPMRLATRFRVNDVESQLAAARDGRGIARLLSYQVADDLARGKLVRLLEAYEPPPLPVHLVTKGTTHRAPAIDVFLELATDALSRLSVIHPSASETPTRSGA
jgi:DNA-binding transcriptional LysR family regulator